jgi:hypothetical protein
MSPKATASGVKMIGVSSAIQEWQIAPLSDPEQDELIRREALRLEKELREFVGLAFPRGDLIVQVTGPHDDPLQGRIWTHTVAGNFALDDLPPNCGAYRVHVTGEDYQPEQDPTTDGSDQ